MLNNLCYIVFQRYLLIIRVATKAPILIFNFQLSIFNCLCFSALVAPKKLTPEKSIVMSFFAQCPQNKVPSWVVSKWCITH